MLQLFFFFFFQFIPHERVPNIIKNQAWILAHNANFTMLNSFILALDTKLNSFTGSSIIILHDHLFQLSKSLQTVPVVGAFTR
jgi:hypothetical protein